MPQALGAGAGAGPPQFKTLQHLLQPLATDHWSSAPHCPAALPDVQKYGLEMVQVCETHWYEVHWLLHGRKHDV